jgi:predicted Zn-dependent peptidase
MGISTNFYRKKLDNGLTVLFEPRNLPVVTSSVTMKIGSEYEQEALKGISHFIEHLVFKGTKNRTQEQITGEIEKIGGVVDAFTSEEITCFWNKLSAKHLHLGIDIASDLALNPLFSAEELERERKVILEEIKMNNDNPQAYVIRKIKGLLYEKPFGMFIAGSNETMTKMKREDILKYYKNYSSNNMILTVLGKADFDEICKLGEKTFPKMKKDIDEIKPVLKNGEKIEKRKGMDQANIVLAYHVPTLQEKNRYASEAMHVILSEGMSCRLFQEIREKRGLAYAIKGFLQQDKNYGYEMIYVGTTKENYGEVKSLILEEIKKLQKLENRDFEEAKEQLIGLRQVTSENSEDVMIELISEENAGNAEEYYKYEDKINNLKLEDVRKMAKLKGYSFFALLPE